MHNAAIDHPQLHAVSALALPASALHIFELCHEAVRYVQVLLAGSGSQIQTLCSTLECTAPAVQLSLACMHAVVPVPADRQINFQHWFMDCCVDSVEGVHSHHFCFQIAPEMLHHDGWLSPTFVTSCS